MTDETVAFLSDLSAKLSRGTLANRPAAGNEGNFYIGTDSGKHIYYDNGTSWEDLGTLG